MGYRGRAFKYWKFSRALSPNIPSSNRFMALEFKSVAQSSEFQIQIAKCIPDCSIWMSQKTLKLSMSPVKLKLQPLAVLLQGPDDLCSSGLGRSSSFRTQACFSTLRASGQQNKEAFTFRAILLACCTLVPSCC